MLWWFLPCHPVVDVPNGFFPFLRRPHRVRRPWGFGYSPLGLAHVHLVPVHPSAVTCPSSTLGWLEGPSMAPEGLFLPVEAGLLPWRGVEVFPLCLGAVAIPLWFRVGSCQPPLGAGWLLPCCWPEAPVDGVSVEGGFAGSGLSLGWASGILGAGCPARWGTWWSRPSWTTLQ